LQKIKEHKNAHQLYQERLLAEGTATKDDVKAINDNVQSILHEEFEKARDYVPQARDWLSSYWSGFMSPNQKARIRNTGEPPDWLCCSWCGDGLKLLRLLVMCRVIACKSGELGFDVVGVAPHPSPPLIPDAHLFWRSPENDETRFISVLSIHLLCGCCACRGPDGRSEGGGLRDHKASRQLHATPTDPARVRCKAADGGDNGGG
jgi:hypothetical protein